MPWIVAMTRPNCEAQAVVNLTRQGYDYYLPYYLHCTPNKKATRKPLFPRYVFIHIIDRWYSLLGTRGISHILLGDDGPQVVPDILINELRKREDNQGLVVLESRPKFIAGDKVKATSGPLAGHLMICEGMKGSERVLVLMELLGRKVRTEVPESVLASV